GGARPRVLLLEDSPLQQARLRASNGAAGCVAMAAATPAEAEGLVGRGRPALALAGAEREGRERVEDGVRVLVQHAIPVGLMSASGRATVAPWGARLGFVATLAGPFDAPELARVLAAAGVRPAGM